MYPPPPPPAPHCFIWLSYPPPAYPSSIAARPPPQALAHALPALPLYPAPPLPTLAATLPHPFSASSGSACNSFLHSPYSSVCARCQFHRNLHWENRGSDGYHSSSKRSKEYPLPTPSPFVLSPRQQPSPSPTTPGRSPTEDGPETTPPQPPRLELPPLLHPDPSHREHNPSSAAEATVTMSQASYMNILARLSRLESYAYQENLGQRSLLQTAQLLRYEYHQMKELGEQLEEEVGECCSRIEEGEERLDRLEARNRREMTDVKMEEGTGRSMKRGWEEYDEEEDDFDERGKRRRSQ